MMSKRLLVIWGAVALLSLQFTDCLSAMTQDQQSMQCCGSMPCDPSNQSHDCCKGMVSAQSPSVVPVPHVTRHAPVMVVTDILASPQLAYLSKTFTILEQDGELLKQVEQAADAGIITRSVTISRLLVAIDRSQSIDGVSPRVSYCAFVQVSDPTSLTATFVKKIRAGLPSAVPRWSVEKNRGPAFL
jgi:hypothetical protein